jgi:DNA-3-methyladenine glycosylase I
VVGALATGEDGRARCWWGAQPEIYLSYHDLEWGRASTDDQRLFEKICLEGFQAGLSWLTVLRKRANFRRGFEDFDPERVAVFGEAEIQRLLADEGIIRHQGKIRSVVNNGARALELIEERGSLAGYFWSWASAEDPPPIALTPHTEVSTAISKDLKRRGWSFVGPTTVYAFMQAMGLVNDHLDGCHVRERCSEERRQALELVL